jgi:hypothetical protein
VLAAATETAPGITLPPWITVREAISLSLEIHPARTILDDEPARRLARQLGLSVIGTLGILLVAKRRGSWPASRNSAVAAPHYPRSIPTTALISTMAMPRGIRRFQPMFINWS